MARYILRYVGQGAPPEEALARIVALKGVAVLDKSPRMFLVEGPPASMPALESALAGWLVTPEVYVPLPDTRRKKR